MSPLETTFSFAPGPVVPTQYYRVGDYHVVDGGAASRAGIACGTEEAKGPIRMPHAETLAGAVEFPRNCRRVSCDGPEPAIRCPCRCPGITNDSYLMRRVCWNADRANGIEMD